MKVTVMYQFHSFHSVLGKNKVWKVQNLPFLAKNTQILPLWACGTSLRKFFGLNYLLGPVKDIQRYKILAYEENRLVGPSWYEESIYFPHEPPRPPHYENLNQTSKLL